MGERITVVCGHYGSGKTNLSVNLALESAAGGGKTALADLDLVNPYFRTADFAPLLAQRGVELIAPRFANSNLDIPCLPPRLASAIGEPGTRLIIDVGGDDDGATALGGYAPRLTQTGYEMLYVINRSRYLEDDPEEELGLMEAVESCSRLKVTGLVNNTNLAGETTPELIQKSMEYIRELSRRSGKQIAFTTVSRGLWGAFSQTENLLPIDIFVKVPWQK